MRYFILLTACFLAMAHSALAQDTTRETIIRESDWEHLGGAAREDFRARAAQENATIREVPDTTPYRYDPCCAQYPACSNSNCPVGPGSGAQ